MAMKRGFFGKIAESGLRAIVNRALNLKDALPLAREETKGARSNVDPAGERARQRIHESAPARRLGEESIEHRQSETRLHLLRLEKKGEVLHWEIPHDAIARARLLLTESASSEDSIVASAELRLSFIVLTADEEARVERSEAIIAIESAGKWPLPERPTGSKSLASIGIAMGERFASIAHLAIDD